MLVIGPPLVGKSTLVSYLRQNRPDIEVFDHDEEVIRLGNGLFPEAGPERVRLWQEAVKGATGLKNRIFFSAYIPAEDLRKLKPQTSVVQITASRNELWRRAVERARIEPDNDAYMYLLENLEYQSWIRKLGLIDFRVTSNKPAQKIAERLLRTFDDPNIK